MLPDELLSSAFLDENTALLRVRHEIVDPRGHVPSQVDSGPIVDGLDGYDAIMEMTVASGAVMEFGRNRDSGRSQLSAHRARLGLRRVRLSMIGIPHDREPLYADARCADRSDEACEATTVVRADAAPGILDFERDTASRHTLEKRRECTGSSRPEAEDAQALGETSQRPRQRSDAVLNRGEPAVAC